MEQLSPCPTTTEAHAPEPMRHSKRSQCNQKPIHHARMWFLLATARESLWTATKTQHGQKGKEEVYKEF